MKYPLNINSEIGELKSVVLHRPGKEVENLTPKYLERLLFDDIPYLPAVQKEHDYFADVLRNRGIEVLYLERLMEEALHTEDLRQEFIDQVLNESKSNLNGSRSIVEEYLHSYSTEEMIQKVMSGVLKSEIEQEKKVHLHELLDDYYPFFLDPMPNLYFTRDPAAVIGDGISLNKMCEGARKRESLFMDFIMKHHPRFAAHDIPFWYDRDQYYPLEGGDELVLSPEVIAIGVSARTSAQAIEKLAKQIFSKNDRIKKVVAVEIPKLRAYMHLDTVFTMVDHEKFTIHHGIEGPNGDMKIYILEKDTDPDKLAISERSNLTETLKEVLRLQDLILIPCGGGHEIAAAREQWNDGSNTLAIAPGVVVTYDRNYVSNDLLRKNGVEVIEIPSSELSRGRGGPRCMSMPIYREDL
ncbi:MULTISPECIES: arginine deiminase [unclassified Mesobacillus]|jgi:arginine deiminase|uniref:arginine deiminase n=1 Tax=unclassified Mesobacillus TaxID=2675270 RepID=UPI00203C7C5C|nr:MULTISPECIES: arginine deiminase [unclassified Mesobacillus]MCM3121681.1 arginine deiminase [Mesobacillus sp. MER 33]MCM3231645.1 arginine deiminase [Mesobacillus sp. MER 48]